MQNAIELTRGDTGYFDIVIVDENGEEYQVQSGEQLLFTLKVSVYADEVILQKTINSQQLVISHEESAKLNYGTYVYDVQLTQLDGSVTTVVKPSPFYVLEEVNFD